jgi:hypothetical protein
MRNLFGFRFRFLERDDKGTTHIFRLRIGWFWLAVIIALTLWSCSR